MKRSQIFKELAHILKLGGKDPEAELCGCGHIRAIHADPDYKIGATQYGKCVACRCLSFKKKVS